MLKKTRDPTDQWQAWFRRETFPWRHWIMAERKRVTEALQELGKQLKELQKEEIAKCLASYFCSMSGRARD